MFFFTYHRLCVCVCVCVCVFVWKMTVLSLVQSHLFNMCLYSHSHTIGDCIDGHRNMSEGHMFKHSQPVSFVNVFLKAFVASFVTASFGIG